MAKFHKIPDVRFEDHKDHFGFRAALYKSEIGYSLGPLQEPARKRMQAVSFTRKPIWKIALSRVWQGVSA